MKVEIEEDWLDKKNDGEEENPYKTMILNDCEQSSINIHTSQLEPWSILSNDIHYVEYNRNLIYYYELDVKALGPKSHKRIANKLEWYDR